MIQVKLKNIGKEEIIVFVSGTIVMILELIGSRILAPYLGTSIFVWTSLIGIILAALSLGYYLGGRLSLNNPNLKVLGSILLLAGLTISLIPIIREVILEYSMKLGVKFGSIISTLTLFTLPSILLGMVSPYAIALKTKSVQAAGGVAGNLYALSTIGSIFGTFLAGFYLIPFFSSTQILFGLSLILILTSIISGLNRKKILLLLWSIIGFLVFNAIPSSFLLETDSAYNHIRVFDFPEKETGKKVRVLILATEIHSAIYLNSDEMALKYLRIYQLDNLFNPTIRSALALGGGAYVTSRDFLKRYPEGKIKVVEIDPKVTQVARDYFGLQDDPRLKIYHQDARLFLNRTKEKYDVVYGDAFNSYLSVPFQLTTKQALKKIYSALNDNGILVLNIISSLEGKKSIFFQAEYKTLQELFPQIYIFPVNINQDNDLKKLRNIILVASKNSVRLNKEDLARKASSRQKEILDNLWERPVFIEPKIKVLTDDFAPVDYYISKLL